MREMAGNPGHGAVLKAGGAQDVDVRRLKLEAVRIKKKLLKIWFTCGRAHLGGALSAVEILTALYFKVLNVSPEDPARPDRDRFILSKAHAAIALYSVLANKKFFPESEILECGKDGSLLEMHLNRRVPGVEVAGGSLGQGLSIGLGMALAGRLRGLKHRIFVLLGDGELNEGQVWEAAVAAAHYGLGNLIAIIDCNGFQQSGAVRDVMNMEPLSSKWKAFGWEVKTVEDGHDIPAICGALAGAGEAEERGKPTVVIARTIKGNGLPSSEENENPHFLGAADPGEFHFAMYELDRLEKELTE